MAGTTADVLLSKTITSKVYQCRWNVVQERTREVFNLALKCIWGGTISPHKTCDIEATIFAAACEPENTPGDDGCQGHGTNIPITCVCSSQESCWSLCPLNMTNCPWCSASSYRLDLITQMFRLGELQCSSSTADEGNKLPTGRTRICAHIFCSYIFINY